MSLRPARHLRRVATLPGDFDAFYRTYQPRLLRYARVCFRGGDAEDFVQETFARACAKFGTLDPERDPWPWLVVVARNVARDHARAGQRCRPVDMAEFGEELPCRQRQPEDEALAEEESRVLAEALRQVRPADRRAFALRVLDGMTVTQVADLLELSETAVRQRTFRARHQLADYYGAACRGATALIPWPILVAYRAARRHLGPAATPTTGFAFTSAVAIIGLGTPLLLGPLPADGETTRMPASIKSAEQAPNVAQPARQGSGSIQDRKASTRSGTDRGKASSRSSTPAAPPRVSYAVPTKPLAPGPDGNLDIRVTTPVGTVVVRNVASASGGTAPVCKTPADLC